MNSSTFTTYSSGREALTTSTAGSRKATLSLQTSCQGRVERPGGPLQQQGVASGPSLLSFCGTASRTSWASFFSLRRKAMRMALVNSLCRSASRIRPGVTLVSSSNGSKSIWASREKMRRPSVLVAAQQRPVEQAAKGPPQTLKAHSSRRGVNEPQADIFPGLQLPRCPAPLAVPGVSRLPRTGQTFSLQGHIVLCPSCSRHPHQGCSHTLGLVSSGSHKTKLQNCGRTDGTNLGLRLWSVASWTTFHSGKWDIGCA